MNEPTETTALLQAHAKSHDGDASSKPNLTKV
jgi:hypothetical protein